MGKNRSVVVDMVGNVPNFGARNDVKSDVVVVTRKPEQAVSEEKRFLW